MPLHTHSSGERVHTVPGSREDARLHADPAWHLDDAPAPDEDTDGGEDDASTPPEETPA